MNARTQQTGAKSETVNRPGSSLPLFAQPLKVSQLPAISGVGRGREARGWVSRRLAWGLAAVTCGVLLVFARPNNAQDVSSSHSNTASNRGSAPARNGRSVQVAQARPSAPAVEEQTDSEESRRPIDFYTQTVRSNMFSAPQPPPPKLAPVVIAKPVEKKPDKPVVVPTAPVNPFATWSYTGTITMGDQKTALLENTTNKEGQYVKAGDMFMGARVTTITDQMITLDSGSKPYSLAKSDNITVTPLDRSAIPTQAGQNPQAAQQQAQQAAQTQAFDPAMMANMQRWRNRGGGGNGQTFTLPNGRSMNAQQFQRRAGRMNQNFNQ